MKILFNNLVWDAALSSLHPNATYPVTNINHEFLELPYVAVGDTDQITITFATVHNINCFYIGFTNADLITASFYNGSGVLIETKTISTTKLGDYFNSVLNVKSVVVSMSTGETNLYVGTIATGTASGVGTMIDGVLKDYIDNSTVVSSARGQTMTNKVEWLKSVPVSMFCKGFDEWNEVYALFADNRRPVFVDVYEKLDGAINPFYAKVKMKPNGQSWRLFKYTVTATEAR